MSTDEEQAEYRDAERIDWDDIRGVGFWLVLVLGPILTLGFILTALISRAV